MSDWVALSEMTAAPLGDGVLHAATFVCEVALPLPSTAVLIDWQPDLAKARTFSVFMDGETGIVVLDRHGPAVRRHVLPGPLPGGVGTARITYGWNLLADRWVLSYGRIGHGEERVARGVNPISLTRPELGDMCRPEGAGSWHPSLLWFGVTKGARPPERAPWIGLRTPVETARGPVPAGLLRPGDMVQTVDNGLQPVLKVHRLRLPSRGSFAPVILRAPYLGQGTDVLIATDQLLALSGPEVEYMFGVEEVLLPAGTLADGTMARADGLRASTDGIAIDLGLPELILADGLRLLTHGPGTEPPRMVLHPYEAQQLVSLISRRSRHGAA